MIDVSQFPPQLGVILLLIERAGEIDREKLLAESPFADRTLTDILEKLRYKIEKVKIKNGKEKRIILRFPRQSTGESRQSTGESRVLVHDF